MIAIQPKTRQLLGVNQQSYQALKASMALNLRRQLLIAVCDNVEMQNQLATQLEQDLARGYIAGPGVGSEASAFSVSNGPVAINSSFDAPPANSPAANSPAIELARLVFDPEDGNLPKQVADWVRQTMLAGDDLPMVQVLGIEQMTRQPAITQNHFLRSLEKVEALLPRLNTSLLVWLPWPWLRTIQQSATTFWDWRTGLFEFVSDPTPTIARQEHREDRLRTWSTSNQGTSNQRISDQAEHVYAPAGSASATSSAAAIKALAVNPADTIDTETIDVEPVDAKTVETERTHDNLENHDDLTHHTAIEDKAVEDVIESVQAERDNLEQAEPTEHQITETQAAGHHSSQNNAVVVETQQVDDATDGLYGEGTKTDLLPQEERGFNYASAATSFESVSGVSVADAEAAEVAEAKTDFTDFIEAQASPVEPSSQEYSNQEPPGQKPPGQSLKRTKKRRRIAAGIMGGLRTVVTKGVNASQSEAQTRQAEAQPSQPDAQVTQTDTQVSQLGSLASQPETTHISEPASDYASEQISSHYGMHPLAHGLGDRGEIEALARGSARGHGQPSEQQIAQRKLEQQKAADDYFTVGMAYRMRIENGERGLELIEPAIAAYEGGLRCLSGPHPDWGSGLNDLGTLYWLKAQQLTDPQQAIDCMAHSVQLYQQALDKLADPNQPEDSQAEDIVGQLYSNMGAVYTMLATQEEPINYLRQAAAIYQKALPLYSLEAEPLEYATLQNSLGSVYWKLAHYDQPTVHLHRAIAAYNEALTTYLPEQQPLDYAAVQNNLGITYWTLSKHEQPALLLKYAISAYRDALNYRTPEVDPAACAITYNNLALAYWDLSKEEGRSEEGDSNKVDIEQRNRYQKNAVTAFEAALNTSKVANSLSPADSAAIFHCLGDVHAQMAETAPSLTEVADSLQKSLYSYLQAIEGIPTDSPLYQGRLSAIVTNLRAHYDQLGLAGQQAALNRIPPAILSVVMLSL